MVPLPRGIPTGGGDHVLVLTGPFFVWQDNCWGAILIPYWHLNMRKILRGVFSILTESAESSLQVQIGMADMHEYSENVRVS